MKKNLGFSLVELMIVAAGIAGVGLVAMNITKSSQKASVKLQYDSDLTLTTNEINSILSDPTKCLASLGAAISPTNINGKFYTKASGSAPANGYGNSGFQITSYTVSGTAPDGVLDIAYTNKNILKGTSGNATVSKKINLYIEGTPGAITSCRALANSSTDIWTRGTGANVNNIYYNNGKVGIGTNTPSSPLHIDTIFNGNSIQVANHASSGLGAYFQGGGGAAGKYLLKIADVTAVDKFIIDSNGKVGIGTNNPSAQLEVAGGIKPGNATTGAICSPEGALAYDSSAHAPVYCASSLLWTSIGSGAASSGAITGGYDVFAGTTWGNYSSGCPVGHRLVRSKYLSYTYSSSCYGANLSQTDQVGLYLCVKI